MEKRRQIHRATRIADPLHETFRDKFGQKSLQPLITSRIVSGHRVEARQALVFQGVIDDEASADAGRTSLVLDVGLVFIAEIAEGGEDRVWRGLAEPAKRRILHDPRPFLEGLDVAFLAFALAGAD